MRSAAHAIMAGADAAVLPGAQRLADELYRSSEDLTRMARSVAVTGRPEFCGTRAAARRTL